MKIVKYVFLLLLLAAVAMCVFIATQSGKYTIKQEKVINVSKPVLYGYVNDFKNWENLGLLTGADSIAAYTFSQNTSGPGASMAYKKEDYTGAVKTLSAAQNNSLRQSASINGLNATIKWAFKDTVGGTKVTLNIDGELNFREKAMALLQHGKIDQTLDASAGRALKNLDLFLVGDLKQYGFEATGIVTKKATYYLGQNVSTLKQDVNTTAAIAFEKLLDFTKKNKITVTGAPFIIYKNYDKNRDTLRYTLSIPIKEEIFTSPGSEYEGGKLEAFNALKTSLKGDYSHLPRAWKATEDYMAKNNLKPNSALPYVVYYTKNVTNTRRPSAWVTDIYTPVGRALTEPADSLNVQMPEFPDNNRPDGTTKKIAQKPSKSATGIATTPTAGSKTPAQASKSGPTISGTKTPATKKSIVKGAKPEAVITKKRDSLK